MSLAGKTLLITGCASGIGRGLALAALARGGNVLATDVNADGLASLEGEPGWNSERGRVLRLDVADSAQWDRAIQECVKYFGRLDVLLNVAAFLSPAWIPEIDVADVHRHFDVNVKGVAFGTRAAAIVMIKQRSGHIVNVASLAALAPVPGLSLYSASKYAVRSLSLAGAHELKPFGVHVTVVCPDAVETPMLDKQRGREQAALTFSGSRVLTVQDLVHAVLDRALRHAPREIYLPRYRGWMARIGDVFPALTGLMVSLLQRRGRGRQAPLRKPA